MENEKNIESKQTDLLYKTVPSSTESEACGRTAEEQIAFLKEEIADLKQQLALYKRMVYGKKSEKTEIVLQGAEQPSLFDEAELEATVDVKHPVETITVAEHKRKAKSTHKETFENLPVEEVVHEVENKTCPECGSEMKTVGKEFVRDEVVLVPARLFVRKHYIEVVKCPECSNDEAKDETHTDVPVPIFRKASVPSAMIPKSYCSPELLAHIVFQKYCQGVPLYRQEKEYKAMGLPMSRTTMANLVLYAADAYAEPVWQEMKKQLLLGQVIHADETVVQVLHDPDKKSGTESRMWVYTAPKSAEHSNILFQYTPTRNGDHAVKFLGDYAGYVVCDGFDGYNKLTKATRIGCWAHARRKFAEALPTDKELLPTSKAAEGLAWCNRLYALEREYEEMTPEEKRKARSERTKEVLDGFYSWIGKVSLSGGTKLAKAIQYAKNEREYLSRFVNDSIIPIDNNRAENAIRPFVIGRKNWLFCDSAKGAKASAILYSLVATATANGLNVETYLTELFSKRDMLMPWS